MKRPIYIKMLIGYLLYVLIAFIIICTFTQKYTAQNMERKEANKLYREAALISSDYASDFFRDNISLSDFQSHMEMVSSYLSCEVWIVNNDGQIMFNSSDSLVGKLAASIHEYTTISGFDIADFGSSTYMISNFYSQFDEPVLTVYSPITISYITHGYIVVHKPVSMITKQSDGFFNITFYTVALILLVAIILLFIFTRNIYIPLRKITKAAGEYAKGDFTVNIDVHSTDEIGYLANTLNYMATELDTLEEDQRKFVSNVSHDFRSPLTSIKGYIEAMLDGTIPIEMQNKYLNIILFETERLNKLTQNLIDLNQFGHHGIRLDIADFDINNMIRSTILTFEGKCREKNISFDLVLTGKELFVSGDMIKVQQVLYNLIDNATKFSNNDSSIKIETNLKNDKVFISVKDSGIGIPKDSIKKIWDRFYKTDSSRGKDKKGTGLGLAIVKEIIQAHNENINCISTEGVGTEFIFTLPISKREET